MTFERWCPEHEAPLSETLRCPRGHACRAWLVVGLAAGLRTVVAAARVTPKPGAVLLVEDAGLPWVDLCDLVATFAGPVFVDPDEAQRVA